MLDNMKFYDFIHKQILVFIIINLSTAPGYLLIGYFYSSMYIEMLWFVAVLLISLWGYRLRINYLKNDMDVKEKEVWLTKTKFYLFFSSYVWTFMFVVYALQDKIELHYISLVTQIGISVVAATLLSSQKRLAIFTVVNLMFPVLVYFILIDQTYAYLLAFFSIVLSAVLLYSSTNTFKYLYKSQYQAYHDRLTSLGNRRYFIEFLENTIKRLKSKGGFSFFLLIDLDHFKTINDSLGHDVGDMLLIEVSSRMKKLAAQNNSIVLRLGGDEFSIISGIFDDRKKCLKAALSLSQELLEVIKQNYNVEENSLFISASIGVTVLNDIEVNATQFIKEADIAMYEAKHQGRDGIIIFNKELSKKVELKLEIERLLRFSLENNEISLRFQPQINSDNTKSCEVLVRWNNLKLGFIPPDVFIPIAEQTGYIIELGYYILEESFKTLREWDEKGIEFKKMSINISILQMLNVGFIDDVKALIEKYLTSRQISKVIFEITETSLAQSVEELIVNMRALKELGINFSLDDFGTGYSSLSYLSKLPISELKIDKSFIDELRLTQDGTIVRTILDIAKNMKLEVVAEGVEEEFEKNYLIENNCDILQGYYFSMPITKEEFENYFPSSIRKI
jgi:diguanylate cyclase